MDKERRIHAARFPISIAQSQGLSLRVKWPTSGADKEMRFASLRVVALLIAFHFHNRRDWPLFERVPNPSSFHRPAYSRSDIDGP